MDALQPFREKLGVALVKLDVVLRGGPGLKADRLANDECDSLSLGFPAPLRSAGAVLVAVHHFVRELMGECTKLLRRRLARQEFDFAARRSTPSRGDIFGIFKDDALPSYELAEPFNVFARIASDVADLRQILSIGLADVLYRDLFKYQQVLGLRPIYRDEN